jgi:uncharacterized membrane-anchored protein YitT (DUF2179 family)
LGAFLQGMSMSFFLFPHSIPSGGAAGFTILLNYWFGMPYGVALWFVNVFFLFFALNYFGKRWTVRTILSVFITSVTISILSVYLPIPHINLFFDIIIGSTLFGIGVGLLIRVGSSSGGMVIPALMIATHHHWSPGKTLMGINLFIFLLTSFVIDYTIIVYAIFCQLISTMIIDYINDLSLNTVLGLAWRRK